MEAKLTLDQLVAMFDLVNGKRNALSKDLSSDLINQLSKYKVGFLFLLFVFFQL